MTNGDAATFDGEQVEERSEREGIDTHSVNKIARTYRRRFGESLEGKLDVVGGIVLIGLGFKTLLEHLLA